MTKKKDDKEDVPTNSDGVPIGGPDEQDEGLAARLATMDDGVKPESKGQVETTSKGK